MSIATKPAPSNSSPDTLQKVLERPSFKMAIAKVLPKHITADRMARIAITMLTRTPNLAKCDEASFLRCMMDLSQWGLEPDGRRAHLIPRENRARKTFECTLNIDYKGLVELALRSGTVSYIHCDIVCDNDEFDYNRGELLKHKMDFKKPRGKVYAVYSLIRMKDGSEKCEMLSAEEVNAVRERSPSWHAFVTKQIKSTPWKSDWNEMAKKTAFRRASKWIPLSAEVREAAEVADEAIDGECVASAPEPAGHLETLTDQRTNFDDPAAVCADGQGDAPPIDDALKDAEDQKTAATIYWDFKTVIDAMAGVALVVAALHDRRKLIQTAQWSDDLKAETLTKMSNAMRTRIDEIHSSRGPRNNGPPPMAA